MLEAIFSYRVGYFRLARFQNLNYLNMLRATSRRGQETQLGEAIGLVPKPMTATEILQQVDVPGVIRDIFKNGSRPLKLQAVNALWDRALGKPK